MKKLVQLPEGYQVIRCQQHGQWYDVVLKLSDPDPRMLFTVRHDDNAATACYIEDIDKEAVFTYCKEQNTPIVFAGRIDRMVFVLSKNEDTSSLSFRLTTKVNNNVMGINGLESIKKYMYSEIMLSKSLTDTRLTISKGFYSGRA